MINEDFWEILLSSSFCCCCLQTCEKFECCKIFPFCYKETRWFGAGTVKINKNKKWRSYLKMNDTEDQSLNEDNLLD